MDDNQAAKTTPDATQAKRGRGRPPRVPVLDAVAKLHDTKARTPLRLDALSSAAAAAASRAAPPTGGVKFALDFMARLAETIHNTGRAMSTHRLWRSTVASDPGFLNLEPAEQRIAMNKVAEYLIRSGRSPLTPTEQGEEIALFMASLAHYNLKEAGRRYGLAPRGLRLVLLRSMEVQYRKASAPGGRHENIPALLHAASVLLNAVPESQLASVLTEAHALGVAPRLLQKVDIAAARSASVINAACAQLAAEGEVNVPTAATTAEANAARTVVQPGAGLVYTQPAQGKHWQDVPSFAPVAAPRSMAAEMGRVRVGKASMGVPGSAVRQATSAQFRIEVTAWLDTYYTALAEKAPDTGAATPGQMAKALVKAAIDACASAAPPAPATPDAPAPTVTHLGYLLPAAFHTHARAAMADAWALVTHPAAEDCERMNASGMRNRIKAALDEAPESISGLSLTTKVAIRERGEAFATRFMERK